MEFTFQAYKRMLAMLEDNGYEFTDYFCNDKYEKCVILRHDIDMSIEKAFQLAQIESKAGVKSTFFVLLGTHFYNIAERSTRETINEIRALGHEIGLHFDELNYHEGIDVESEIIKEAQIMKQILGFEIRTVSMHRPSEKTLASNYKLDGKMVNSYGDKFFKTFKYISDSRRRWRENVIDIICSNEYPKLQILTHPFWYNDIEISIEESLKEFITAANQERYVAVNDNFTDLQSIIDGTELVKDKK